MQVGMTLLKISNIWLSSREEMVEIKRHWLSENFLLLPLILHEWFRISLSYTDRGKVVKNSVWFAEFWWEWSSSPACHSASIPAKINSSPTQAWQEPISFPTRIQSDFLQTWPVYWTTNSLHPPRSFPELVSVRKDLIIAVSSLEWSVELNFFRIRVWSDSGVSQTVEGILTEENSRLLFFPSWNRR